MIDYVNERNSKRAIIIRYKKRHSYLFTMINQHEYIIQPAIYRWDLEPTDVLDCFTVQFSNVTRETRIKIIILYIVLYLGVFD